MTTLTELQLTVAATQQSITSRKECELLLKNTNFKNPYQKGKSTELANVLTAQENQKGLVHKSLSLLKKYTLESNKGNMDASSLDLLATRCDTELERAMILMEFQLASQKNQFITKKQAVYDDSDTMELKKRFHHRDNQTKNRRKLNSAHYVKALAKLSSSELLYILTTAQQHDTDLGRQIKQRRNYTKNYN